MFEEPHEAHFSQDIDAPSDDFYQVHQAKQGKPPPTPHIWVSEESPQKSNTLYTQETFKKYDDPDYVPAKVNKILSPEAVAAFKKYNAEAINKFAKKRYSCH